jgi:hypothetical protein
MKDKNPEDLETVLTVIISAPVEPELIKEMVEDAISFYMEEGYFRNQKGEKVDFEMDVQIRS